jgi:hypothetical protein
MMQQHDIIVTTTKTKPINSPEPKPIRNSDFEISAKISNFAFPASGLPPAQFD